MSEGKQSFERLKQRYEGKDNHLKRLTHKMDITITANPFIRCSLLSVVPLHCLTYLL